MNDVGPALAVGARRTVPGQRGGGSAVRMVGRYQPGQAPAKNSALLAGATDDLAAPTFVPCQPVDCPACIASSWQGNGGYTGVDRWSNIMLRSGQLLCTIGRSFSGFFATPADVVAVCGDLDLLCRGLQIGPPTGPVEHAYLTLFEVLADTIAAWGTVRANPHYGPGGLSQVYLPTRPPWATS